MSDKDFYGREIIKLEYKNGDIAKMGDVIRWQCFDYEEFTTWTFTGIYRSNHIIYLGGGVDFGGGIGASVKIPDVIVESEENDECDRGIEKIGNDSDLMRFIKEFAK